MYPHSRRGRTAATPTDRADTPSALPATAKRKKIPRICATNLRGIASGMAYPYLGIEWFGCDVPEPLFYAAECPAKAEPKPPRTRLPRGASGPLPVNVTLPKGY